MTLESHLVELDRLRRRAELDGDLAVALKAKELRGKASGLPRPKKCIESRTYSHATRARAHESRLDRGVRQPQNDGPMLSFIRVLIEGWREEFFRPTPLAPSFGDEGWQLIGEAWKLWRTTNPEKARGWCVNTYGRAAFAGQARIALEQFHRNYGYLPSAAVLLALTISTAAGSSQHRARGRRTS